MKKRTMTIGITVLCVLLAFAAAPLVTADTRESVSNSLDEFSVPGSPLDIVTVSPGHLWFTLPDENAIGELVVTSTIDYHVDTYTVPTSNSEPYNLVYAGGYIWFTERLGNNIGRLDPATDTIEEFAVPTANSQPAGIDATSDTSTVLWFAERAGNALGMFDTADHTFTEYPFPDQHIDAQPEDVHVENANRIWFTAPGVSHIGRLRVDSDAYAFVSTGSGSEPWSIDGESGGSPWLTDRAGNRIGQFFPQTLADFRWYKLSLPDSRPFDITAHGGIAWFTESGVDRAGQVQPEGSRLREHGLPAGSAPTGITVDAADCVWIAASGTDSVVRWCSPYFHVTHLPLIKRE